MLGTPPAARSAHFALHHLPAEPLRDDLSTGRSRVDPKAVDECASPGLWLGTVVPKRHARRAVTRSLIKRQMRAAVARHAARLAGGLWVLRLKSPYAPAHWPSAASTALRSAARGELDRLLAPLATPP